MSFQSNKPKSSYGSNNSQAKPAYKAGANAGQKKELKPTTHYMVTGGEVKDFVKGIFLTETSHGGLTFVVKEAIEPGVYFINKKKEQADNA